MEERKKRSEVLIFGYLVVVCCVYVNGGLLGVVYSIVYGELRRVIGVMD